VPRRADMLTEAAPSWQLRIPRNPEHHHPCPQLWLYYSM